MRTHPPKNGARSVGGNKILEHLEAEAITASNINITCTGAKNEEGGSNIDYYIISIALLGIVIDYLADFAVRSRHSLGLS